MNQDGTEPQKQSQSRDEMIAIVKGLLLMAARRGEAIPSAALFPVLEPVLTAVPERFRNEVREDMRNAVEEAYTLAGAELEADASSK